jgi:para-aminobenzoate synthetase component 1
MNVGLSSDYEMEQLEVSPENLFSRLQSLPYVFWLDSGKGPEEVSQWSFLGAEPFALLDSSSHHLRISWEDHEFLLEGDPLAFAQELLNSLALKAGPDRPPFVGGAVGWFGYDLARNWERFPALAKNDTHIPEMRLAFYRTYYAYDHRRNKLWRFHRKQLSERFYGWLRSLPSQREKRSERVSSSALSLSRESLSREEYLQAVHRLKEYIAAGDIYQANLTRRIALPFIGSLSSLYLRLRQVNPAPFGAYLGFGDLHVLSASPERFLCVEAGTRRVETRPIKGTRPRSPDLETDRVAVLELQHSEKDRAENLMIVDVHRNDLGRMCEIGSIHVPALWKLESYQTVHHLVSVVQGRLRSDRTSLDLLRAAFPAGSITGAPKLRAIEILESLEPVRRGIYTGAIGYLGWDGGMDLSVAIRTMIAQGGWIHYGVGGGIVADSIPEAEYQETLDKAKGMEAALEGFIECERSPSVTCREEPS